MPKAVEPYEERLLEALAANSHESWAGWTRWMLDKIDAVHESGESFRARWERQMATPYSQLSEAERDSDRAEARKIVAILREEPVSAESR